MKELRSDTQEEGADEESGVDNTPAAGFDDPVEDELGQESVSRFVAEEGGEEHSRETYCEQEEGDKMEDFVVYGDLDTGETEIGSDEGEENKRDGEGHTYPVQHQSQQDPERRGR